MSPHFRQGETAHEEPKRLTWMTEAEKLMGKSLLMDEEADFAFEDGYSPKQYADGDWHRDTYQISARA